MPLVLDHTSALERIAALRRSPCAGTGSIVMVDPAAFDIRWAINAHMRTSDGALHTVDVQRARSEWQSLRRAYEALGYPVRVMPATMGLCDQVFAANPAFPFSDPKDGACAVVLSRMRHAERAAEPELLGAFLNALGIRVVRSSASVSFEGTGDLVSVPGQRLLLGGMGPRSDRPALEEAAAMAASDLVLLRLADPRYYHLDTCIAVLDPRTALWVPEAFATEEQRWLGALFPRLIAVPENEGEQALAANAHCPDGRHVLIDANAQATMAVLKREGYVPIPIATGEFRKSGGSVFCLKLALPSPA